MSAIRLEHVSRSWGPIRAVDDVSFEASAGQMLVLLGPSGCGKSTTLRLVAGLEQVSAGRILIGGEDVTERPPAARHLSMVFQSYALFPHLSVAENIVFGLRVRRVPAAERQARLARVADLLGLSALLARKPSQLSGGQQQRVALGRAIIAETPVCLMDEPLSNLDAQLRLDMRREIRALQQKLGVTMVYVTHDQTEAMSMADQVILLREGRVEQDASPAELYARPASSFAARFIGTPPMNILKLADAPAGAVVAGTDGPALLPGRGGGLLLGVRPEEIALSAAGGVGATVKAVEYLGADSILTCEAGGQTLAVRAPGRVERPAGATVRLAWGKEHVHVFDAETGRRRDDVPTAGT
ncbi:MAG TPA: ABC transporter ATP-binding protein [Candidatus Bathyarchaeia archaeon]|nr:ABC transporter ATP-binding protein [Candidatus Bathyarchaeia archaeon]